MRRMVTDACSTLLTNGFQPRFFAVQIFIPRGIIVLRYWAWRGTSREGVRSRSDYLAGAQATLGLRIRAQEAASKLGCRAIPHAPAGIEPAARWPPLPIASQM
jgi:hypothetical protein